ncbi:MAG: hypothetical protein VXW35_05585 [Actinomycetota bacterium]|nr:hypothetical protein [Actinomycetota bacterium]
MPRLLTAKLTIAICMLVSLLAGCGGSNTEDAAPTPVPEAQEEQSSSSEPEDAAEPETVDGTRAALIALVTAFQPSDDVPIAFIECWIDKTLEFNEYEPQELLRLLTTSEEAEELDANMGEVVFTCIGELSPADFAAVLESGILDEDTDIPDEVESDDQDLSGYIFPETDAPDLVNDLEWADPGVEVIVSPGFTNGYLWSGTISGSGLPATLGVGIIGCEGGDEMDVIIRFFEICDFEQPLITFTDNEGNFSVAVSDPVPIAPSGTCIIIATDPDNNPDTDDGPGAILCSKNTQVLPESDVPDLTSSPLYSDPGVEVTISPGIVDGELWQGVITGSGFNPGEYVGGLGCAATYETFLQVFPTACDVANPLPIGIVDENGNVESDLFPPIPTVPSGTCLLIGTDPDGNPDTEDGQGTLICTR